MTNKEIAEMLRYATAQYEAETITAAELCKQVDSIAGAIEFDLDEDANDERGPLGANRFV